MDDKQKEMSEKLQLKLKDLENRENKLNQKLEEINQKETNLYSEFDNKIKDYESRYNERLEELNNKERDMSLTNFSKVKEIERMLVDYYNSVPWYHNQMWEFKSRLDTIISEFKNL